LLPLTLLLLRLAWCVPDGGRRGTTRHAGRIVTEPPALAGGQRLRLRHVGVRSDDVLSLPRHLLSAERSAAQILSVNLNCSRYLRRSRQDARLH